jgi:flagellar basal-body rod protein FlgB
MYAGLFQSTTIPVLEQVVGFAQARHAVLAGNIANLDTPGYQARDLSVEDFQARMQEALTQQRRPATATGFPDGLGSLGDLALPGSLAAAPPARRPPPMAEVAKNTRSIMLHDQSNVGMEHQVSEMVKNQMQHNMALTIMIQQFRQLQTAISGRV